MFQATVAVRLRPAVAVATPGDHVCEPSSNPKDASRHLISVDTMWAGRGACRDVSLMWRIPCLRAPRVRHQMHTHHPQIAALGNWSDCRARSHSGVPLGTRAGLLGRNVHAATGAARTGGLWACVDNERLSEAQEMAFLLKGGGGSMFLLRACVSLQPEH